MLNFHPSCTYWAIISTDCPRRKWFEWNYHWRTIHEIPVERREWKLSLPRRYILPICDIYKNINTGAHWAIIHGKWPTFRGHLLENTAPFPARLLALFRPSARRWATLYHRLISLPTGQRLDATTAGFRERCHPQCAGAVYGTHMPIHCPQGQPSQLLQQEEFWSSCRLLWTTISGKQNTKKKVNYKKVKLIKPGLRSLQLFSFSPLFRFHRCGRSKGLWSAERTLERSDEEEWHWAHCRAECGSCSLYFCTTFVKYKQRQLFALEEN